MQWEPSRWDRSQFMRYAIDPIGRLDRSERALGSGGCTWNFRAPKTFAQLKEIKPLIESTKGAPQQSNKGGPNANRSFPT